MRPLTSFETPIAGVVNGVTFYERSRGGLDRTGERGLAESVICCFLGQWGKLCTGRISALRLRFGNVEYKSVSDGKYVKKSLHLRLGEL
jgi:hypothetical protein